MSSLPLGEHYVRSGVFTAVTMENVVFLDVAPCRSCVNWRFGGPDRLQLLARQFRGRGISVSRWLQTELSQSFCFLEYDTMYFDRYTGFGGTDSLLFQGGRFGRRWREVVRFFDAWAIIRCHTSEDRIIQFKFGSYRTNYNPYFNLKSILVLSKLTYNKTKNSRGFIPQATYIDRVTAACRRTYNN
jgi:hypothetical protein